MCTISFCSATLNTFFSSLWAAHFGGNKSCFVFASYIIMTVCLLPGRLWEPPSLTTIRLCSTQQKEMRESFMWPTGHVYAVTHIPVPNCRFNIVTGRRDRLYRWLTTIVSCLKRLQNNNTQSKVLVSLKCVIACPRWENERNNSLKKACFPLWLVGVCDKMTIAVVRVSEVFPNWQTTGD